MRRISTRVANGASLTLFNIYIALLRCHGICRYVDDKLLTSHPSEYLRAEDERLGKPKDGASRSKDKSRQGNHVRDALHSVTRQSHPLLMTMEALQRNQLNSLCSSQETYKKAQSLLSLARAKTRPGSGFTIKTPTAIPAACAYIASEQYVFFTCRLASLNRISAD